MRTAVPIDLYCYADFDYTVIALCCNVLYKPTSLHMAATDYNIVIKIKYVSVCTVFNHLLYGCTVLHDNYPVLYCMVVL